MNREQPTWALGVDVGGVLVDTTGDQDTSFFGTRPMETPEMPSALGVLAQLNAGPFAGRIFIVSKAGPKISRLTRDWFIHINFYGRTGIPAHHVHFVRDRADKAPVCKKLGVTHFIDDRLDVLAHLAPVVSHLYLFQAAQQEHIPAAVTSVGNWDQMRRLFPSTTSPAARLPWLGTNRHER